MMNAMRGWWFGVCAGVLLLGCATDPVDMGEDTGQGGAAGAAPTSPTGADVWVGYAEQFQFASGSDRITLAFSSRSASSVTGTVVFGEGTVPPVDPDVGYPPDIGTGYEPTAGIIEGFEREMLNGSLDGARLQFGASLFVQWAEWCELQTPIADEVNPGIYGCLPNTGFSSGENGCTIGDPEDPENPAAQLPVDCGVLALCTMPGVCQCTASGCTADSTSANYTFDLSLAGDRADGTVAGLGSGLLPVHFTRTAE